MKLKSFYTACFSIIILLVLMLGEFDDLREIRYSIVPLSFFISSPQLLKKSHLVNRKLRYLLYGLLLLIIFSLIFSFVSGFVIENQGYIALKELIFVISPIISVMVIQKSGFLEIEKFVKFILFGLSIYLLVRIINSESVIQVGFIQFITSGFNTDFEGSLAFIYGFLVFFLYLKGQKKLFLISLLFLFFFGKRIVFAGILFTALADSFLFRKISYNLSKKILLGSVIFVSTIILLFSAGFFDDLFIDRYGISLNAFTQGRSNILNLVFKSIDYNSLFIGNGFSYTTTYLTNIGHQQNLVHSDIFRFIIEFGLLGFILFYFLFFKNLHSEKTLSFAFLFLILAISDNTFIYVHVMFFYYLLISEDHYLSS
ncbi:hypothetical protein [Christiangramia echinicola]|uniref:O-antigen ligase like membrane protein n=1 Tax=Christiangramia echinicola TaxID=279359 RepID=A0A1H1LTQ9_9FLAO|nr:hypothetical protein [Christiangramia echinicola]SDR78004.1 hypothetical protein SAMN04488552_1000 [Christiangramia echinicola]